MESGKNQKVESGKWKVGKTKIHYPKTTIHSPSLNPPSTIHFPLSLAYLLVTLTGCATTSPITSPVAQSTWTPPRITPGVPQGIYHRVEKGQTLWRIAKAYQVPIEELVRINRIPDATKIKGGQLIFIPGASRALKIEDQVASAMGILEEGFIWPLRGKILSYYGSAQNQTINKGIDIASSIGTPVKATRSGKVAFADEKVKGLGKTVILDHGDGFQTVYGHLSEFSVNPGEMVTQGTVIAKAGDSGRAIASGIHFQIRKNQKSLNPLHYLP